MTYDGMSLAEWIYLGGQKQSAECRLPNPNMIQLKKFANILNNLGTWECKLELRTSCELFGSWLQGFESAIRVWTTGYSHGMARCCAAEWARTSCILFSPRALLIDTYQHILRSCYSIFITHTQWSVTCWCCAKSRSWWTATPSSTAACPQRHLVGGLVHTSIGQWFHLYLTGAQDSTLWVLGQECWEDSTVHRTLELSKRKQAANHFGILVAFGILGINKSKSCCFSFCRI